MIIRYTKINNYINNNNQNKSKYIMSEKIFDEKNSRTALTFGKEMVNKIKDLSILIFGMRGLGVEIAKNLILCSPHEVYIQQKYYSNSTL